jgi:hypothetical protein
MRRAITHLAAAVIVAGAAIVGPLGAQPAHANVCTTTDLLGAIKWVGVGEVYGYPVWYAAGQIEGWCTSNSTMVMTSELAATGVVPVLLPTSSIIPSVVGQRPVQANTCSGTTYCQASTAIGGNYFGTPVCVVGTGTATFYPELSPQRAITGFVC